MDHLNSLRTEMTQNIWVYDVNMEINRRLCNFGNESHKSILLTNAKY